jgi:hypothetical protein
MSFNGSDLEYPEVRRNVMTNGASILKAVVSWYMDGSFDHPQKAPSFAGILASICEGKVKAECDQDGIVSFSLTRDYEEYINKWHENLNNIERIENVIRGPWV